MKCLVISAAIMGSVFIFTSCATNNDKPKSSSPQVSPYAPPNNEAKYDETGFNHWPLMFSYPSDLDTDQASDDAQNSPYTPPNNEAKYDDTGFNHWPLMFSYPSDPVADPGQ